MKLLWILFKCCLIGLTAGALLGAVEGQLSPKNDLWGVFLMGPRKYARFVMEMSIYIFALYGIATGFLIGALWALYSICIHWIKMARSKQLARNLTCRS
jgi:hypothetical protein